MLDPRDQESLEDFDNIMESQVVFEDSNYDIEDSGIEWEEEGED